MCMGGSLGEEDLGQVYMGRYKRTPAFGIRTEILLKGAR